MPAYQIPEKREIFGPYYCNYCSQPVGYLAARFGEPYLEEIYCECCGEREQNK